MNWYLTDKSYSLKHNFHNSREVLMNRVRDKKWVKTKHKKGKIYRAGTEILHCTDCEKKVSQIWFAPKRNPFQILPEFYSWTVWLPPFSNTVSCIIITSKLPSISCNAHNTRTFQNILHFVDRASRNDSW
jgi:hypothetical protein